MSRERFQGSGYDIQIVLEEKASPRVEVWARHNVSGRISSINNLNVILSEIALADGYAESYDGLYDESSWFFSDVTKAQRAYSVLQRTLSNSYFFEYLEKQLDKDMLCGGWNSRYRF